MRLPRCSILSSWALATGAQREATLPEGQLSGHLFVPFSLLEVWYLCSRFPVMLMALLIELFSYQ